MPLTAAQREALLTIASGGGRAAARQATAPSRSSNRSNSRYTPPARVGGDTEAGTLLRDRLRTIARFAPDREAEARRTATGGVMGTGLRLALGALNVIDVPRRAVISGVEQFAQELPGGPKDVSTFGEDVSNPNYGFGTVLERTAPDANVWVKRLGGLTGDILLDPLTYATFGGTAAIKGAGGSKGLIRMAINGSDNLAKMGEVGLAKEMKNLAAKIGEKGVRSLADDEITAIARAAGREELLKKGGKFGVSLNVPFTKMSTGALPGTGGIGRAVAAVGLDEGLLGRFAGGVGGKVSKAIGGEESRQLARKMLSSGDPDTVAEAVRTLDALASGQAATKQMGGVLEQQWKQAGRAIKSSGLNWEEATEALRGRPTATTAGTDAWFAAIKGNPDKEAALLQTGEFLDSIPDLAAKTGSHGDYVDDFIRDATEAGRPYVPRIISDELQAKIGKKVKFSSRSSERAWFERRAMQVGDEVIPENPLTTLIKPGTVDEAGNVAPSLEAQIQSHVDEFFGEAGVKWYEDDLSKIMPKYIHGVSQRTGQVRTRNYLKSFGVGQNHVEYVLDPTTGKRIGVKTMKREVEQVQEAIARKQVVNAAKFAQAEVDLDEAWTKRLAGEVTQRQYDDTVERIAANKEALIAEMRADEERLRKSAENVLRTQADKAEKQAAYNAAEANVDKARQVYEAAQAKVDALSAKVASLPATAPERKGSFEALVKAAANRDAKQTLLEEVRRLPARLSMLEEEAVNARKVALHLENALQDETGSMLMPGAPYMDTVAEHTGLDMSQVSLEDVQSTAAFFAKMADDRLEDMRGIGVRFPADISPEGVDEAVESTWRTMEEGWLSGDDDLYEEGLDGYARAYSMQARYAEEGTASVADLQRRATKLQEEANKQTTDILKQTGTGPEGMRDVQAAQLANVFEVHEARLNEAGYTMLPEQVGAGEQTIESFLGTPTDIPGTFLGPDGKTRRVVVDAQASQRTVKVNGQDVVENLAAQRAVGQQVLTMMGEGNVPTTYLGTRGAAMEIPADAVPLSIIMQNATPDQIDTITRQFLDGSMIDVLFGHELGMGDVMRTEGGRMLRYPQQVGLTSNRHIYDQLDRGYLGSIYLDNTEMQAELIGKSTISRSETSERLIAGWERLLTFGTYASNSGTGIDWRVMARNMLGDEVGEEVGTTLNKRFKAIEKEMREAFLVDTDEVIEQAIQSDVRGIGNLGSIFDPEYRTFQSQPGLKQAELPPPGGAETWTHTATMTNANPTGDVRLDQTAPIGSMLDRTSAEWFDWLFGPNTTATNSLRDYWKVMQQGRENFVNHHPKFHTIPDRVKVYGAPSYEALGKEVRAEGRVSSRGVERFAAKGQEVAGQEIGMQGGRGMDFMANDLWERTMRLRPDIIDTLMPMASDPHVKGIFEEAKRLRAQAEIQDGLHLTQSDALEIAARRQAGILDESLDLKRSLTTLPRDRHRPMAAELQAEIMFGEVTDKAAAKPVRYELAKTVRDSLAVDTDVIVMATAPGHVNPYVHALPTSQVAMSVPTSPGGDAVAFVRQTEEAYKGAKAQRAAVTRRRTIAAKRDAEVARTLKDWHELQAWENQFSTTTRDLINATEAAEAATATYGHAVAGKWGKEGVAKAQRLKNLADYEVKMTQAALDHAKAGQSDLAKMAKIESTYARMRREAQELGVSADWNDAVYDYLARNTGDFEFILHQGWKGHGFGFQAPENVVNILETTARGWEPATGSGLESFLKGYDRVHNWMKGWLTTSFGFHFRNTFGGTFNNWMAGVDVVKSTMGWGNLYRKAGVGGKRVEGLLPHEAGIFHAIDRMGILQSGTFYEEFNIGLEGASLNPFAGTVSSGKAFIAPYASRKAGENLTEPMLRGTMAYDRLLKAMKKGRIQVNGVKITRPEQITAGMVDGFVKAVNDTSGVAEEILDDIAKYHFDYSDLSAFEKNVGRRVIPFYTWTRRNVPLQIELLMTQPKGVQRYMAVKRNLELGTEEDPIVPSYFAEQFMIRTPWETKGSKMYGTIDLPFKDPFKLTDPGQMLGMVTPMIKTPFEAWAGKQFFSDVPLRDTLYEAPGAWSKIPGFMQALSLTGRAQRHKDGGWYMREKDAYLVGQYIPFLNQARRLLPSEPKYQNRVSTQFASYLTGVTMRANTPQDQEAEVFRRNRELEGAIKDLKATGYIPAKA